LTPGQSSSFDQCPTHCLNKLIKVSILCFNWLNTIFAVPRQQLSEVANGMAMVMANGDGNCDGGQWQRRQWLTARATATAMADGNAAEMAAGMVNSNRNGNGWRQRQRQWAIVMATAMELATAMEMMMAMAMAMATARATITKEGLPLHVAAMCSAFGGATPCLHPYGHKRKCMRHGGDTAKSACSPSGGGFLTAHHGLYLFIFYNYCSVYWTTLSLPPCIIQALKNPVSRLTLYLLHSSKNPVHLLTIYPGSYCTFCQSKPGQGLQWL
jgi:hypothetical protein